MRVWRGTHLQRRAYVFHDRPEMADCRLLRWAEIGQKQPVNEAVTCDDQSQVNAAETTQKPAQGAPKRASAASIKRRSLAVL